MKNKQKGFSILEVLISAGIFTIVILGISQTVLLMHRYARGNLCQMQAHLIATSYFEQLLCHTHPLELIGNSENKTGSVDLLDLKDTTMIKNFNFRIVEKSEKLENENTNLFSTDKNDCNVFKIDLIEEEDTMTVYLQIVVQESPMYEYYINKAKEEDLSREEINPPEGFQSVRMKYWWTSPFATTNDETEGIMNYLATLPSSELYAIRPILPDEADYEG